MPLPPSNQPTVASANAAAKGYPDAVQKAPLEMAGAIQSGNPDAPGAVAATTHVIATSNAVDQHQQMYNSKSWWQTALGDVGKVITATPIIGTVARWANKGLQEVQSDYKFIHSVYTDHGFAQGLLATLGVGLGATVGSLAGPEGTALGAAFAASLERDIGGQLIPSYQKSYQKSIDPNYQVSIGRDLSNLAGDLPGLHTLKNTNYGLGQFVSGVTDAAFDFEADPLANAGKVAGALKSGKYLEYKPAVDSEGQIIKNANGDPKLVLDGNGKPIIQATIPLARNSEAATNFLMSLSSGRALSSEMVQAAYDGSLVSNALGGKVLNPVKQAFDHIATLNNPVEIQLAYPGSNFDQAMLTKLANAKTGQEVADEIGKSIYSGEMDERAMPATAISLPTRTLARQFSGTVQQAILKRAGDTTVANERNLLLPKAMPVLDEQGNQVYKTVTKDGVDTQVPQMKMQWGGLYTKNADTWNGWNALAGKIRTFTGYKALTINKKLLEQSGEKFNFDDHGAGTALYNMFYYAMPRDVALEKAAAIMAAPTEGAKQALYAQGVKEVIKAAGLPDDSNIVDRVMSHAQRVTTGGMRNSGNYGNDTDGNVLGTIAPKQNYTVDGVDAIPNDEFEAALWAYQRGANAFINFKELRNAMRQMTVHGMMYSKADDFWSYYTDKIFAPLSLFTTGFGLRVAGSEALHQVIRNGLGSYIGDRIAFSGAKYKFKNMSADELAAARERLAMKGTPAAQALADHAAQMLTDEDHAGLVENPDKAINENSITKMIDEKNDVADQLQAVADKNPLVKQIAAARGLIRPFGYISSKVAPYLPSNKLDVMLDWLVHMHGLSIPAGVASDHLAHYSLNAAERASQFAEQYGHGATGMDDITSLTGQDPHYHIYWAQNLSKLRNEKMAQDIANDYLRLSKDPQFQALSNQDKWAQVQQLHQARIENPKNYADLRDTMVGLRNGDPASFSSNQVKAFAGLVQGKDGTIHDNLIQNIADGMPTKAVDLKQIPAIQSPLKVLGREPRNTYDNPLQRVIQMGYRTFINPVMDGISREPIFGHYLYENYRSLQPLLDSGKISKAEALQFAGQKAVINMVPLIHNPALRSQFSVLSRNLLPFYFAQEQAIKRYGRLAYQAPQAFRDFQMINHGINNPGFVHTDSSGNKYMVYPLIGEFGNAAVRGLNALGISSFDGLPESVTGNVNSLASVLPEAKMPGLNPLATIPLGALSNHFPWASKITNVATGGYPASNWLDAILPNSAMRDIFNGMMMDDKESSVHNAILSAIAAAYYHGDLPDNFSSLPASVQQQYMDRIDNNARTNLFMKGILSFFLPLAPNVSNDYYDKNLQSLRSEFQSLQSQINPDTGKQYTLPEATSKFLAEHGSRAVSYTAYTTQTGTSGADLPLNDQTLTWLNQNGDLMNKYKFGAAYLIPQTKAGADALQVENDLLTKQLRSKDTPQDFLDSVYIQAGWAEVAPMYNAYQTALKQARDSGNRQAVYQYTQEWNNYASTVAAHNPTWYADYQNPSRKNMASQSLADFEAMDKAGKLTGPQAQGIKSLMTEYQAYHQLLLNNTITVGGITKHTAEYSNIQNEWFNYLTALEANPATANLTNVINGVFKRVS